MRRKAFPCVCLVVCLLGFSIPPSVVKAIGNKLSQTLQVKTVWPAIFVHLLITQDLAQCITC